MRPSGHFLYQCKGKWSPDFFTNIFHFFSNLFPERPVLTLVSQQNIYVFEGMDVWMEAQVKAYPYPWVSLSRVLESNESVIQETSNVSSQIVMKIPSITKAHSGDYVLYTENTVGNDTVTVRVNVEGKFILLTCTYWCWIPGVGITFHISTEMPLIVMRKGALVTRCHQKILIS